MRLHVTLKYLSILMVVLIVALLCQQAVSRPAAKTTARTVPAAGTAPAPQTVSAAEQPSTLPPETERSRLVAAAPNGGQRTYNSRLAPGIISAAPRLEEVPAIRQIPWLSSEIMDAYEDAEEAGCQMLLPGQPVQTPLHLLADSETAMSGRIAALTIRLDVDDHEKSKLPASTKGVILQYLRDHEIALEPTIHQDPDGRLYFGGDCRAAFYRLLNPEVTVEPESMVKQAMGRIRTLGVLGDLDDNGARTLVLAIRYARTNDPIIATSNVSKYETELLFFHLPADATLDSPRLSVFVSSDGRLNLHRLNNVLQGQVNGTALLSATIRFDSFVMMGVYPASPVVTGVQPHKSVQMPVEPLLRLTAATADRTSLSFQSVLDQFSVNDDVSALVSRLSRAKATE